MKTSADNIPSSFSDTIEIENRRRKRLIVPTLYFILEIGIIWLLISLFEMSFDIKEWLIISIVFFAGGTFGRLVKTINVYKRQKEFSDPFLYQR